MTWLSNWATLRDFIFPTSKSHIIGGPHFIAVTVAVNLAYAEIESFKEYLRQIGQEHVDALDLIFGPAKDRIKNEFDSERLETCRNNQIFRFNEEMDKKNCFFRRIAWFVSAVAAVMLFLDCHTPLSLLFIFVWPLFLFRLWRMRKFFEKDARETTRRYIDVADPSGETLPKKPKPEDVRKEETKL